MAKNYHVEKEEEEKNLLHVLGEKNCVRRHEQARAGAHGVGGGGGVGQIQVITP
jgi:hypothetical protein